MSLILEALKKVERERATPEQRGFLVLGPTAWAPSRSNLAWVLGMIAAAAVAGGAVYLLTRPPASAATRCRGRTERVAAGSGRGTGRRTRGSHRAPRAGAATGLDAAASPGPPPSVRPRAPTPSPSGAPAGPVLTPPRHQRADGVPVAVVNDRVVREGDSFDGVRILRIGAAEVEVEVAGARRTLRF